MGRASRVFGMATVATAVLVGSAEAQEKKKESAPPQGQEMPMPKPGPEHEILKKDVGVWDATVESTMEPGGKPNVSKGVETNTLLGDGLWLIQDFKGEVQSAPFQGHGVTGYDPSKKKYVGTWVDSMSTGLSTSEGTYDPKTKTMTTRFEGPGPDGTIMKMRTTSEWKDANNRVFTMYSPAGQGGEFAMMKITYKRRSPSAAPRATN
jgi:Protein of unknown function (DUF1579)